MEAGVVGRGERRASLREAAGMVDQLSGLTLPVFLTGSQGEQEQRESLMQHIQVRTESYCKMITVFCGI